MQNQRFVLVSRPVGMVDVGNFALEDAPTPTIAAGVVLVEGMYFSVDPYMRGRLNARKSYSAPWEIGQPPEGGLVGIVREVPADSPFAVGDIVRAFGPWQKLSALPFAAIQGKLNPALPIETQMSVLGMTGLSAYLPIVNIAGPIKPGTVAYVSGAAGAVGSVAAQVLRNMGCDVVASAGSDEKVAFLKSIGIDKAFNYKTTSPGEALPALAPGGLDLYFDNVGGETLEFALTNMKQNGTIISCGMIADYNLESGYGVRNLFNIITKRLKMQGFIVSDFASQFGAGVAVLAGWLAEGKLIAQTTVVDGFENIPKAFVSLFHGDNTGKLLVKC